MTGEYSSGVVTIPSVTGDVSITVVTSRILNTPIYDGLVAWFDVTNTSKWNSGVITSMVGEATANGKESSTSGTYIKTANSQPSAYDNGFVDVGALFFNDSISDLVGSATAFTLEFLNYMNSNTNVLYLKANTTTNASATNNANVYTRNNNISGYKKNKPYHYCGVFSDGSIDWYVNGSKLLTETTSVEFASILASYIYANAHNSTTGAAIGDVRLYNRALTADEIAFNYSYTQKETDYSTAPVFE